VYSPPKNGLARCTARLEHARCPEPFVDPHLIHSTMIAVARELVRIEEREVEAGGLN
jgi:hypothetical protein